MPYAKAGTFLDGGHISDIEELSISHENNSEYADTPDKSKEKCNFTIPKKHENKGDMYPTFAKGKYELLKLIG